MNNGIKIVSASFYFGLYCFQTKRRELICEGETLMSLSDVKLSWNTIREYQRNETWSNWSTPRTIIINDLREFCVNLPQGTTPDLDKIHQQLVKTGSISGFKMLNPNTFKTFFIYKQDLNLLMKPQTSSSAKS